MPFTILHVAAPAPMGGLESVVRMLAAGQHARGHRVHVALVVEPGVDPPLAAQLRAVGAEAHVLEIGARAYLAERTAIRRLCLATGADIVHTHGYRPDIVAGLAARSLGIPFVSTLHGFIGGSRRGRINEWLQRRALRSAAAAIAVSRPIVARLTAAGLPERRIHLLPNAWSATDVLLSRADARSALEIPAGDTVVGWVGRVGYEKGPDIVVEAMLGAPDLEVRLSIIGDGRERPSLEARTRAAGPSGDRIHWHGPIPAASRYYPAFDVYVLSSRTEGTPISLLEAIAAGVPVVATAVGGVPDVVGPKEALLVDSGDAAGLAQALRDVVANPGAARARAEAARKRLTTQFASGAWLDRHDAIYRAAIAAHQPRISARNASR